MAEQTVTLFTFPGRAERGDLGYYVPDAADVPSGAIRVRTVPTAMLNGTSAAGEALPWDQDSADRLVRQEALGATTTPAPPSSTTRRAR